MTTLSDEEVEALEKVLDYLWEDEQRHYEEAASEQIVGDDYEWNPKKPVLLEDHIFAKLVILDKVVQQERRQDTTECCVAPV